MNVFLKKIKDKFLIKDNCIKSIMMRTNEKAKADDEWEKLWDEIYEFQHTLSINSLPSDEEELERIGLYVVLGRNAEKLFINKELSKRLFTFRCLY